MELTSIQTQLNHNHREDIVMETNGEFPQNISQQSLCDDNEAEMKLLFDETSLDVEPRTENLIISNPVTASLSVSNSECSSPNGDVLTGGGTVTTTSEGEMKEENKEEEEQKKVVRNKVLKSILDLKMFFWCVIFIMLITIIACYYFQWTYNTEC